MLKHRYEEYRRFPDHLPFVLASDLKRTAAIRSREANWHENLEIQICHAGEGTVLLDGKSISFCPDDIIVVNSNVIHYTGTQNELTYSCLILDPDFCHQANINPADFLFEEHFRSESVKQIFFQIECTYPEEKDSCRIARLRMLTLALLIELRENHTAGSGIGDEKNIPHQNVKSAIRYIRSHYTHKITLDEIAQSIFVNKYVLSRQFKKVTQQTIMDYTNGLRCSQALNLLTDGARVSEAAAQCGFTNLPYFARTFKKNIGILPSECRKKEANR